MAEKESILHKFSLHSVLNSMYIELFYQ